MDTHDIDNAAHPQDAPDGQRPSGDGHRRHRHGPHGHHKGRPGPDFGPAAFGSGARSRGEGSAEGAEPGMPFGPGGPFGGGPFGGRRGGRGRERGRGGPGPFGRPGGWQQADLPPADDAAEWLAGRLPGDWFTGTPQVSVDREEILVVGELPPVDGQGDSPAAAAGRITRFREQTRDQRIAIAQEAEARYGRKVSWGASIGEHSELFTHLAVPVMTRLRQPQRQVLDTLVDAGVARSRSEALAWSVALVGQHIEPWLAELREKMAEVDKLRAEGPAV